MSAHLKEKTCALALLVGGCKNLVLTQNFSKTLTKLPKWKLSQLHVVIIHEDLITKHGTVKWAFTKPNNEAMEENFALDSLLRLRCMAFLWQPCTRKDFGAGTKLLGTLHGIG